MYRSNDINDVQHTSNMIMDSFFSFPGALRTSSPPMSVRHMVSSLCCRQLSMELLETARSHMEFAQESSASWHKLSALPKFRHSDIARAIEMVKNYIGGSMPPGTPFVQWSYSLQWMTTMSPFDCCTSGSSWWGITITTTVPIIDHDQKDHRVIIAVIVILFLISLLIILICILIVIIAAMIIRNDHRLPNWRVDNV